MAGFLFDQGELKITLELKDAATQSLVLGAFTDMALQPVQDNADIVLTVSHNEHDQTWVLQDSTQDHSRTLAKSGDLVYHLSDRMIFHIADKTQHGHCLHAAAVQLGDSACVIPAHSGAGKSSLTAWLVANGCAYVTDELIVVDQAQKMSGIARPIQIKTPGLPVIQPLLRHGTEVLRGDLANAISAASLGGQAAQTAALGIGLFLFPQYDSSSGYELSQLSSADAGLRLMSNHVNARNLQDHGFRAMMKLIRNTPCYSLNYGGFDKLPVDFSAQLLSISH